MAGTTLGWRGMKQERTCALLDGRRRVPDADGMMARIAADQRCDTRRTQRLRGEETDGPAPTVHPVGHQQPWRGRRILDSSGEHAFLTTPEGGETTAAGFGFGELQSAHAARAARTPGVPGIHGRSPRSANGPRMMDRTPAPVSPFGRLASDQTATQAWFHGNGTPLGAGQGYGGQNFDLHAGHVPG